MSFPAGIADEGMKRLLETEILAPDGASRNEAVGAGIIKLHEKARAGDTRNMARERCPDLVGEEVCEQTIEGLALRLHRAALSGGNGGCDLAKRGRILIVRQRTIAKLQRTDQATMHDEVGISADRRGEMRIDRKSTRLNSSHGYISYAVFF